MSPQTSKEFWDQMQQLNERNSLTKNSAYAFDSAWVVAMALNFSLANGLTYEKLLNRGSREAVKIRNGIQKVNFPGVTVSALILRGCLSCLSVCLFCLPP